MSATLEPRASSSLWIRALFMLLCAILYGIAEFLVVVVVLCQFVLAALGEKNANLLRFGRQLATYIHQILDYVMFNTEVVPFPLSQWPSDAPPTSAEFSTTDPIDTDSERSDPGDHPS